MSQLEKCDRRSLRSQRALRQALASELAESGDLSRINVASLTERAGLTRRTFYSHYRDIPDFINQIEDDLLVEIREHLRWLHQGLQEGCQCRGYHLWTFIDNWSWSNAYKNRYGLVRLERESGERRIKQSGD